MIVCITGMPAAGKSSIGKALKRMGYTTYELGDIVRKMMRERHIRVTPESDREFTIWLRKRYGGLVTIKRLAKEVDLRKADKIAIIGVRSRPELDYIRKRGKTLTIAILAPARLRYLRMKGRGRADAQHTFAEFRRRDRREERFGLWGAIKSADYVISGTGTIPQLQKEVKEVVEIASIAKAF